MASSTPDFNMGALLESLSVALAGIRRADLRLGQPGLIAAKIDATHTINSTGKNPEQIAFGIVQAKTDQRLESNAQVSNIQSTVLVRCIYVQCIRWIH
ncbi:uncharacterized protein EI90DRAFT_3045339 [Cantharellus anzutake]|uniref:uncharacterized protein n=1 Tax=Cantharellus anzutake TaxID=1750568 RepID=UPI0019075270|nr:uncharacterized protein EI90DRAFT_3045339 [Cantharellus anzutake]KAF8336327.1 hypothetical protein EI90DRAFT_3045339 [Cantharellus anzutake]